MEVLTQGEDQMTDFISSSVEQIATAKADLIEGLLRNAIPHWQVKLFTWFPKLAKHSKWHIEEERDESSCKTIIRVMRGKKVISQGNFTICLEWSQSQGG